MFYLIYVSSANSSLTEKSLSKLLVKFQHNNDQLDITGMLLYKSGNFMQMLEGDKNTVLTLYEKIKKNPLHKDVITILSGDIEQRNFENWSMGFCNMDKTGNYPDFEHYIEDALLFKQFQPDSRDAYRFIVSFNEWMRH